LNRVLTGVKKYGKINDTGTNILNACWDILVKLTRVKKLIGIE